jgi:hypothetical protein
MNDQVSPRYTALRSELERLSRHFEAEAGINRGLYAQRFWDADHLSDEGWSAFARRASGRLEWEEWHVLNGGEGVIRVYSNGNAIDAFKRLAEGGWLSLAALEQEPGPGLVTLGDDAGLCGWMSAVFETALAAMTPTLRLDYSRWGLTDEAVEEVNEFDPDYWCGDGGERHPAHPFVQTLAGDLFSSSATAIACWLDPDHVPTVDVRLDDLPIRLPAADAPPAAARDNPVMAETGELTTREAAAYLKIGVDTLKAHVLAGRLPRRNVSPHGSGRGPFLYKVADLAKLRDGSYRRTLPRDQPKAAPAKRAKPAPPEPGYDHLDLD